MTKRNTWIWAALLVAAVAAARLTACSNVAADDGNATWADANTGWIANRADAICGLDDPRLVSHPAVIAYPTVINLTPEMKRLRDENIDPASPLGIQLRMQAVDRVRTAAEKVRLQTQHCSIWKYIRHRDGREVPDVTANVIAVL